MVLLAFQRRPCPEPEPIPAAEEASARRQCWRGWSGSGATQLPNQFRPRQFHRQAFIHRWQRQHRAVSCGNGADEREAQTVVSDAAIFVATGAGETLEGGVAHLMGKAGASVG